MPTTQNWLKEIFGKPKSVLHSNLWRHRAMRWVIGSQISTSNHTLNLEIPLGAFCAQPGVRTLMRYPKKLRHDCEQALHDLQQLIYDVDDAMHLCGENRSSQRDDLRCMFTALSEQLRVKKKAFLAAESDFKMNIYDDNLEVLEHLTYLLCMSYDIPLNFMALINQAREGV